MSLQVTCSCGQKYTLPETMAGKKTRCQKCSAVLAIPVPAVLPKAPVETQDDDEYRLAEEPVPVNPVPAAVSVPLSDAAPVQPATRSTPVRATLPFFMAGYDQVFRQPKLFRVYLDGTQLLFIFAGPFHASFIADYQMQYSAAVKQGAVAGLSAGASGAAVGAGAVAAGLAIDWIAGRFIQSGVAARANVLDAMTLEELRREVDENKQSFRASASDIVSAVIEPPSTGFWSTDTAVPAYLRLKHQPTGAWHLMLFTDGDVELAIRALRQAAKSSALQVLMPGGA